MDLTAPIRVAFLFLGERRVLRNSQNNQGSHPLQPQSDSISAQLEPKVGLRCLCVGFWKKGKWTCQMITDDFCVSSFHRATWKIESQMQRNNTVPPEGRDKATCGRAWLSQPVMDSSSHTQADKSAAVAQETLRSNHRDREFLQTHITTKEKVTTWATAERRTMLK